jgi:hypothetical protein
MSTKFSAWLHCRCLNPHFFLFIEKHGQAGLSAEISKTWKMWRSQILYFREFEKLPIFSGTRRFQWVNMYVWPGARDTCFRTKYLDDLSTWMHLWNCSMRLNSSLCIPGCVYQGYPAYLEACSTWAYVSTGEHVSTWRHAHNWEKLSTWGTVSSLEHASAQKHVSTWKTAPIENGKICLPGSIPTWGLMRCWWPVTTASRTNQDQLWSKGSRWNHGLPKGGFRKNYIYIYFFSFQISHNFDLHISWFDYTGWKELN